MKEVDENNVKGKPKELLRTSKRTIVVRFMYVFGQKEGCFVEHTTKQPPTPTPNTQYPKINSGILAVSHVGG